MRLESMGLVGNCQFSALVHRRGDVVWCCLPRFDSEPVFGSLLDRDGGVLAIRPADGSAGTQRYLENTNVLETSFQTPEGDFRVLDFAPRYLRQSRMYRPARLVRIIELLRGAPRICVKCEPRLGWSKQVPRRLHNDGEVVYEGFAGPLRLASDVPPTRLDGQPFILGGTHRLVLAWGGPVEGPLAPACDPDLRETKGYWRRWVKHCNVPQLYQREVIRSALALKLHCFEDTGAIVAAMTTSIPESAGSGRTWDYRYCWLRDSYYALEAFRLLGHFEERAHFIQYLLNIAANTPDLALRPLYRVDGGSDLSESVLGHWSGYNGEGPVRIGNAAALHQQHDVFGEMVLALAPVYLDARFHDERSAATLGLLERLAEKAIAVAGTPDAGIWELRTQWQPQTFSALMCWAGADRMARIAAQHHPARARHFRSAAAAIRRQVRARAWNAGLGSFTSTYGGQDLDAALLQMAPLRFLPADDPQLRATVDAIHAGLVRDGWIYRYRYDDGFGTPTVAFVICTYWLIEALVATGRQPEARTLMSQALRMLSPLGLLSEDYDSVDGRMWGNFPQAYSHVGLIHGAFAASPAWTDFL